MSRLVAYEIVNFERVVREDFTVNDPGLADTIFNLMGPRFDVVQLWSKGIDGRLVYRQF